MSNLAGRIGLAGQLTGEHLRHRQDAGGHSLGEQVADVGHVPLQQAHRQPERLRHHRKGVLAQGDQVIGALSCRGGWSQLGQLQALGLWEHPVLGFRKGFHLLLQTSLPEGSEVVIAGGIPAVIQPHQLILPQRPGIHLEILRQIQLIHQRHQRRLIVVVIPVDPPPFQLIGGQVGVGRIVQRHPVGVLDGLPTLKHPELASGQNLLDVAHRHLIGNALEPEGLRITVGGVLYFCSGQPPP